MKRLAALLLVAATFLFARSAHAHKPSDSYLSLEVDGAVVHVRWDIALRDLDYAIGLDKDSDGKITWGEVDRARAEIAGYATKRLTLKDCPLDDQVALAITGHSDGAYAVLRVDARCSAPPTALAVGYELFFDVDPQHRSILRVDAGGATRTHTLSARERSTTFDLRESGRGKQLASIVHEGILHIWQGYDHILFLLALLLPSVLRRGDDEKWTPVPALKPALMDVLRIVTAFTIAHSITLSLAALGVVTLPSRLVESAIAASVVLAALNNLRPIMRQDRWMAAFLLGLMHGFGFSSTLQDLNLPRSSLVSTLFGFNLGVEIGQIAIVAIFVPIAFAARKSEGYRKFGLVAGSVVILVLATIWLVERALLVKIIS